jgi:hypothetical protein
MSQSVLASAELSVAELCRGLELPYASFQRWRRRQAQGLPVLRPPGPPKVGPLPLDQLQEELEALVHRPKRTRGTGDAQERLKSVISRRAFQDVVRSQRRQHLRQQRQKLQRIQWHAPNVAWAMDATEIYRDPHGGKLIDVVVQDLGSGFRFDPFMGLVITGHETTRYLKKLFAQHGPPLFLKRDNGGIFNTPEVNQLLARLGVIPLNSPVKYPRYNGAIEKGIGELKHHAVKLVPSVTRLRPEEVRPLFRFIVTKCNFAPRRSKGYQTAAKIYTDGPKPKWDRRERQKIFAWIGARAKRMLSAMENPNHRDLRRAWRRSAESWLRCQGLISVSIQQQPVTPF